MSESLERLDGDEDASIVQEHLNGNPDAFRRLYEKYGEKVFASAYRIVGEHHAAADLAQEIFVKIFHELRSFKFESRFSTWLFRVTVNHAINKANEVKRHSRIREKIEREGRGDLGGTREGRPLDERVQQALQALSPKLRAIVSLRYLDGLSYEEIAEVLEISLGTVKSRLFLAHETLRPMLKEAMEAEK